MSSPLKGLVLMLAAAAWLVAAPEAVAKKKPVDPEALVTAFLADLDDDLDDLEFEAGDLLEDLDDDFEDAVDDARLTRVLKIESRADKAITKGTNQFQKRANKQLAKVLRTLSRADDADDYAAQVQAAVAQALVEVQLIAESLRQELSLLVDDAIVRIEDDLDDDDDDSDDDNGNDDDDSDDDNGSDGDDNPSGDDDGTPDQGSGDN